MARDNIPADRDSAAQNGDDFYRNAFYERLDYLREEDEDADADFYDISAEDALINNPYLGRQYENFGEKLPPQEQKDSHARHLGEIIRDDNKDNTGKQDLS